MSMTATELLDALDASGSAESTIALGRKFIRLMSDDAEAMVEHFRANRVTEGTLIKARDLLSGRSKPADYQGKPPVNSKDADAERLARHLGAEMGRVFEQLQTRQSDKQAEAAAHGVGAPHKQKEALAAAGKR